MMHRARSLHAALLAHWRSNPLWGRIARGLSWSLIGSVASRALALVASVVTARILGREGFGQFGLVQTTLAMFAVFVGLELGLTANKHVAEFKVHQPSRAGSILSLSLLTAAVTGVAGGVLLAALAPWLSATVLEAPELASVLRIGAGTIVLAAFNGALSGALGGFEAFAAIARASVLASLTTLPVAVLLVYRHGLEGAALGLLLTEFVLVLLNGRAVMAAALAFKVPVFASSPTDELPILWRFSLPALLSGLMVTPTNWLCMTLLARQPAGFSAVGVFNAASQWFAAILFLPGVLGRVVLPLLSEAVGLQSSSDCRNVLASSVTASATVACPLALVLSFLSRPILRLYGDGYAEHWPTLVLLLWTAALVSIQAPVGHLIAASGRMWLGFAMNMGWAVAYIGLTVALVGHGAVGLASARFAAYAIHALWTLGFAHRFLRRHGDATAPDPLRS